MLFATKHYIKTPASGSRDNKVHYRKLLLQYVLAKINECATASDVVKSINVLAAIRWVAQAWFAVRETTIRMCFQKAGILDATLNVNSCGLGDEDPILNY